MAITKISIDEFIIRSHAHPVIDVRSPGEYAHAHIPGAYSLPLFTDEERKVVGTIYKQEGREQAIRKGLEYFGVKTVALIDDALAIVKEYYEQKNGEVANKTVIVHCWRGGMRSAGIAWMLDLYGFTVYTLVGGYKVFRNWVLNCFETSFTLNVLGGFTGSGKTEILKQLEKQNFPVIDLENIASHKGSSFGGLGMPDQCSQEMFENKLATVLAEVKKEHDSPIWLEDESRRIGKLVIPPSLYQRMQQSHLYFLEIPFSERLKTVCSKFGGYDTELLKDGIKRIQKRLGGLETKTAIRMLEEGNIAGSFGILLKYYDKHYLNAIGNKKFQENIVRVSADHVTSSENASILIEQAIHHDDRTFSI